MAPLDSPQMSEFLTLARRVRTQAGAEKYGEAVGEEIVNDNAPKNKKTGPITPSRLRSMLRQIEAAEEAGNDSLAKRLREDYTASIRAALRSKAT